MRLHTPYVLLILSIIASILAGIFIPNWRILPLSTSLTAGLAIIFIGLILGLWVKKIILSNETTLNPYGEPSVLITDRAFSFSRNPMYVSYVLTALGGATLSGSVIGLIPAILYFLYLNFQVIPYEEANLKKHLSNRYSEYSKKVRRWI